MKKAKKTTINYFIILTAMGIIICTSCSSPTLSDYAPYLKFQAKFESGVLKSDAFPRGAIKFDEDIKYIDSETFILYNVARCEIHLFGEIDDNKKYKRLYWIQYESYLPNSLLPEPMRILGKNPTYNYADEPHQVEIGGRKFYTSNSYHFINKSEEYLTSKNGTEDSDFAHVARLLYRNGININAEVIGTRMVFLDPSKKKELMIICYEVMDKDILSSDKLDEAGENSPLWTKVSSEARKRASMNLEISFLE